MTRWQGFRRIAMILYPRVTHDEESCKLAGGVLTNDDAYDELNGSQCIDSVGAKFLRAPSF